MFHQEGVILIEHPNNPYNKPTWWGVGLRKDAGNFDLYYHSSWDWLMPVVEKIEKECSHEVVIFSTHCNVNQGKTHDMGYIGGKTKIEAVYKSVIEFIKWYNQNKTNPMTKDKILSAEEAIKILENHNKWRRSGDGDMIDPAKLGEAIDIIVAQFHPPTMTEEELRDEAEKLYLDSKVSAGYYVRLQREAHIKARKMGAIKMDREE